MVQRIVRLELGSAPVQVNGLRILEAVGMKPREVSYRIR